MSPKSASTAKECAAQYWSPALCASPVSRVPCAGRNSGSLAQSIRKGALKWVSVENGVCDMGNGDMHCKQDILFQVYVFSLTKALAMGSDVSCSVQVREAFPLLAFPHALRVVWQEISFLKFRPFGLFSKAASRRPKGRHHTKRASYCSFQPTFRIHAHIFWNAIDTDGAFWADSYC